MEPKTKVSFTFLGTSHHRTSHHSILTGSFEQIHDESKKDNSPVAARLFDGVGSKNANPKDDSDPMPGSYAYNPFTDKKIIYPKHWIERFLAGCGFGSKKTRGLLGGYGTDSLILEAILYIEKLTLDNHGILPKTVNLQGFSRGADTCVRLANEIYSKYGDTIEVNLFLIDDVPGSFRRDDPYSYTIPPNVKAFNAVIMLNEHKPVFKPQHKGRWVFSCPEKTNVAIATLPGNHGEALAKYNTRDSHASYYLTQDWLLKFNQENHSLNTDATIQYEYTRDRKTHTFHKETLKEPKRRLTNKERFHYCCEAMREFTNLDARPETKNYYKRTPYHNRHDYVSTPELFINQEHRELFKELYPKLFHWFFEKNYVNTVKEEEIKSEKKHGLKHHHDFFVKFLNHFNWSDKAGSPPDPQGIPMNEAPTFGKPLVRDELTYLQHALQSTIDYYHYHCDPWEKNKRNDVQVTIIREALQKACVLSSVEATHRLNTCINTINQQPNKGFIAKRIGKIRPPSLFNYYENVIDKLNFYLSKKLSFKQKESIEQCINNIKKAYSVKTNDFDAYQSIKAEVMKLSAQLSETLKKKPIKLMCIESNKDLPTLNTPTIVKQGSSYFLYDSIKDIGWRWVEMNPHTLSKVDFKQEELLPSLQHKAIFNEISKKKNILPITQTEQELFSALITLSKTDLDETDLVDKPIRDLEGYIYRRELLTYVASFFGISDVGYNMQHLQLARYLNDELKLLKLRGLGNNATEVNKVLNETSFILNPQPARAKDSEIQDQITITQQFKERLSMQHCALSRIIKDTNHTIAIQMSNKGR
jgi:hypothetical protein